MVIMVFSRGTQVSLDPRTCLDGGLLPVSLSPLPTLARRRAPARRPGLSPGHHVPGPAPWYTSPSSGPGRQTRRRDSTPPYLFMTRPEIFSFFGLDKIGVIPKPPGYGTKA